MSTQNIIRITLTSFLAYAAMASILSPIGIITKPISELFNVALTDSTSKFTFITSGILIGSFMALFIFDWLKIKTVLILNCALSTAAITLLYIVDSYAFLPISFVVTGTCFGINLTAAAIVITCTFSEGKRASMLLLTDCFYSLGAVSSSYIAARLMAGDNHWVSAYGLALVIATVIILIASLSKYPEQDDNQIEENQTGGQQKWPVSVYFCATSLFLYMLGMASLFSWAPNYAQSVLKMPQEQAGQLISYLFSGMLIGQIIMFFLVLKFPMGRLILISSGFAALFNASLWNISNIDALPVAVLLLGIFAGGLMKTFITYGTLSMHKAPTRLVSFLMLSTCLGTALAPAISSSIVAKTNITGGLVVSSLCYFMTFVFAAISIYFQSKSQLRAPEVIA